MKDNEKLTLQSHDWVADNQHAFTEFVKERFPNCITEGRVDMDLLRQEVSSEIVEGPKERYRLEWAGKREAIVAANTPTNATLRPIRDKSVNFDTTENLYIEGDNLEVLKLLQESYLGKIKMIYIDPPYNTGNEFVYNDDFSIEDKKRMIQEGLMDEDGNILAGNTNSQDNSRYHSDWLSMMYPRLKMARTLLSEDGVIFISIDDNEFNNLRKLCDELFGESNYVDTLKWKRKKQPSFLAKHTAKVMEYVLIYSKHKDSLEKLSIDGTSDSTKKVINVSNIESLRHFKSGVRIKQDGDGVINAGRYKIKTMEVEYCSDVYYSNGKTLNDVDVIAKFSESQSNIDRYIDEQLLFITAKNGLRRDVSEAEAGKRKSITDLLIEGWGDNQDSENEQNELFGTKYFDYTKPLALLSNLVRCNYTENNIILDFFSGSATTAHAVMQLNAEDGGNRKFIMVQLPEKTDETKEAYKAGYKNICEIGEERIRRAAKKIQEENPEGAKGKDMGFRVFRLDSSNMKEVKVSPDDLKQTELDWEAANNVIDNIKEGRTGEDLLFQVMLAWGLPLSLPVAEGEIGGKKVYRVEADGVLILLCCFENGVDEAFTEAVAKQMPMRVLFRDSSFSDDNAKENVRQLLKQLSPNTEMRVL